MAARHPSIHDELCERGIVSAHDIEARAIALRAEFAPWLGWLVTDPANPLVFVTDDHTDRRELVRQCLTIGYDHLAGEISLASWRALGGEIATTPTLTAAEVQGRPVLDVRQSSEYRGGHVPGAGHVELGTLPAVAGAVEDGAVVMCGHGERAATAASLLEAAGRRVAVLVGGPGDWAEAHHRPRIASLGSHASATKGCGPPFRLLFERSAAKSCS